VYRGQETGNRERETGDRKNNGGIVAPAGSVKGSSMCRMASKCTEARASARRGLRSSLQYRDL
jgi:hypothetical protein